MSVIVSPLVKPGERLPKSAFYPYLVGTTTKAAREGTGAVYSDPEPIAPGTTALP